MLYMASPVATSAINTNRTKVIGTGLTLKSAVDVDIVRMTTEQAKDWQKRVEAEFALWAEDAMNCDAIGLNNFYEMQQLAMKSWLMSGDVFALIKREETDRMHPYSLRIHLVEADRICTPFKYRTFALRSPLECVIPDGDEGAGNTIYDGVEVDKNGKVVAYHICDVYPQQTLLKNATWTRVLARGEQTGMPNVLHIMDSERPDQFRGVPYLAQVIEPLLQLRRFTESELMAALIQSFFSAWIETNTDPAEIPFNETGGGDIDGIPSENPNESVTHSENEYEMGPGTIIHLQDGEKVVFGNPNIPSAGFDEFVKTLCRMVGAALELPYDVLIKEFNSSYSASRGALLEAWEAFKMRRAWFVNDFCKPIYEIWLAEAVAIGRIKAVGFFEDPLVMKSYCKSQWIGPVQGQLDPKKEAQAAILLTSHAIKTHEQVTRELAGGDWEENMAQILHEDSLLSETLAMLDPSISDTSDSDYEGDENNE